MKNYESGFLVLILTGILVMVVGLALMASVARPLNDAAAGFAAQGTGTPSSLLAMRTQPANGSALAGR